MSLNRTYLALLGRPRVLHDGEDISRHLKYRKGIALLGYLASHQCTWFTRERLADLLWPELGLTAARTNLRQVLNNLCSLLNRTGESLLRKGDAIALIPTAGFQLDISLLNDQTLDAIFANAPENRYWREHTVEPRISELCGDFLSGLLLSDTPEFDEWLETKRLQFRSRATLLLEQLCALQHSEGRLAYAIVSARQLVALAPLDESRNQLLMSLLAESGDVAGALEVFETLQQSLSSEIGVAPEERLVALSNELQRRLDGVLAQEPLRDAYTPERRHVAALYCASEKYLGEDLNDSCASQISSIVEQFGGTVVSNIGRSVLSIFGLGKNSERATQRAILAARRLQEQTGTAGVRELRIGLSAGPVPLRHTPTGLQIGGDAPELARFICWSAPPGKALACSIVAKQMKDSFHFASVGNYLFPGQEKALELFLLGERKASLDTKGAPFCGRREELSRLWAYWEEVCAGKELIAVLRASAGIGKTRLAGELMQAVAQCGGRVRYIACSLERQHQPLAPILAEFGGDLNDGDERSASKSATFDAVIALVNAQTANAPMLLLVDDLHWADQATLELLNHLIRGPRSRQLFLVLTTRPEVALDYPSEITRLVDLPPLDAVASHSLIAACDCENAISPSERDELVATSAGIPLFIEHEVKNRLEGGHQHLSVAELLQAELERLGNSKTILRAASVLGRHFERRHLQVLLPDTEIATGLARAHSQRLIDTLSAESCAFRHALIRDAAYHSLPPSLRKTLHERAARLFVELDEASPEEIAQHFSAAECFAEGVAWWIRAGDEAISREFAGDAMKSYQKALALLENSAMSSDTAMIRTVRMRLGYAAHVAEGYGSSLTYRLFSDMVAEIEALPDYDSHQLFAALSGCYMGSSSFDKDEGLRIAYRLLALARTDAERLMACFALGNTLVFLGRFGEALQWQERCMTLASTLPLSERIRYGVDDPAITSRAFNCWALWFLGRDAAACAMADEAIALAREGKRVHGLCFVLTLAACLHRFRGDIAQVAALAGEVLAIAKQYGFPLWEGAAGVLLLWAKAKSSKMTDTGPLFAAAELLQRALPSRVTTSRWMVCDALIAQGEWQAAEELLETALRDIELVEEQYCRSSLLYLKAECLAWNGAIQEANDYLREAVSLATDQGAIALLARMDGEWRVKP